MYCIGLVLFMYCQPVAKPPPVVSDFCQITRNQLNSLTLTDREIEGLTPQTTKRLARLKRKYKRLCT